MTLMIDNPLNASQGWSGVCHMAGWEKRMRSSGKPEVQQQVFGHELGGVPWLGREISRASEAGHYRHCRRGVPGLGVP